MCRAIKKFPPAILLIFLSLWQLNDVLCGWDSFTETQLMESVVVDGRSIKKTFVFSDTSLTDKVVKVQMRVVHTDNVFHDFHSEDVRGKTYSLDGPADTVELELRYTLDQKYQQYWIRFWYTIDNAIEAENNTLVLDVTPRYRFGNLTIDKYILDVRILLYSSYFWRLEVVSITRHPDSQIENNGYLVMNWEMSGQDFGAHVTVRYKYSLYVREVQGMLIGGLVGAILGVVLDRLFLLRRRKNRIRKGLSR